MRLSPVFLAVLVVAACSKSDDKPAPKAEPKEGTAAATATASVTGAATGTAAATAAGTEAATAAGTGAATGAGTAAATGEGEGAGTAAATGKEPGTAAKAHPPGDGSKGGAPAANATWQIMDQEGAHGPDDTFDLKIDCPATVTAGAPAKFVMTVTPGSAYKINVCDAGEADCTPYPVKLELSPPAGVTAAKSKLTQDDVTAIDKQHLVLAFEVTPDAAGDYTIPAKFKFAVCQDEFCKPRKLEMSFALAAK